MSNIPDVNRELGILEEELAKLKSAAKLIGDAKNAAQKAVEVAEIMIKQISELTSSLMVFSEKMDTIDFPSRLDKLDATVSGINQEIQNIQSRIDVSERHLSDSLRQESHSILRSINDLKNELYARIEMLREGFTAKLSSLESSLKKSTRTNRILLIFVLVVSFAILVLQLLARFKAM